MVSDITDKLLPRIEEWQNRPLSPVYPIVFIDAVHFSVRDDGVIRKLAAYVVLGMNEDGMKEVLSIVVGENESSKYWLSVLNSLKNRGVQDILILCSDGLTGIKDAISTAFPKTEQQRCIVHMVRNTLKYVANKDMKAFAKDLKTIYTAADEEAARKQVRVCNRKMVCPVSKCDESLARKLGCNIPNLQVFQGGSYRILHYKCHRIAEFLLS